MLSLIETLSESPGICFDRIKKHIIYQHESVRQALLKLNELHSDAILFVCDLNHKVLGSLTDGDLRRGFIKGLDFNNALLDYTLPDPLLVYEDELHLVNPDDFKEKHFLIIPIVDREGILLDVLNLRLNYSLLPAEVIIMAGGKGARLMPLTEKIPKPLLRVGNKPILEHNIDRLIKFGFKNIHLSVNYLADQIKDYFGDGSKKGVSIKYICEAKPLGTLGSVKLAEKIEEDYLLVMNSDILTTIDFASFFRAFIHSDADMAVATTDYQVEVPYGILEVDPYNNIHALKEKPRFTYHSNAGIYLAKKELLRMVPDNKFYNVTDLMKALIHSGKKLVSYPILGYWLDIGKHEDYLKAQEDIKYLKL